MTNALIDSAQANYKKFSFSAPVFDDELNEGHDCADQGNATAGAAYIQLVDKIRNNVSLVDSHCCRNRFLATLDK